MATPQHERQGRSAAPSELSVFLTGVTPFEDLPGFQFYSLLKNLPGYRLYLGDDSEPALAVLRTTGAEISRLTHPGDDEEEFVAQAMSLCRQRRVRALVPGADAHLFALGRAVARFPEIGSLCPAAAWLAERGIGNKRGLQDWVSRYLPVPARWAAVSADGASLPAGVTSFPVVVKGMRKGAGTCHSAAEVPFAVREILDNPANRGPDGGYYLEEEVEGEERGVLLVGTAEERGLVLGLRKLATTQTGTTLAAAIEAGCLDELTLTRLGAELAPGMALELELRGDGTRAVVFEVNVRFPSWLGALGEVGRKILAASLEAQCGGTPDWSFTLPAPGTLIYRLPQSGYLTPSEAFAPSGTESGEAESRRLELLWPAAGPHRFLVK